MTITEAADKTDNKYTILLLSSSEPLAELLQRILESLQAKDEFKSVTLERQNDPSRVGGPERGPLQRAALIICDQDKLDVLSEELSDKRAALPPLVVVESCTAAALDAVYSSGYLPARGAILPDRLRAPEDQGAVVRPITRMSLREARKSVKRAASRPSCAATRPKHSAKRPCKSVFAPGK